MESVIKRFKFSSVVTLGECPDSLENISTALRQQYDTQSVESAQVVRALFAVVHHPDDVRSLSFHLQGKLDDDPLLWIAYPKKSSKKNSGALTRDVGWNSFSSLHIEQVSQFSIDDDYSALRFRRVDKIKNMTRPASMAISPKTVERLVKKPSKK